MYFLTILFSLFAIAPSPADTVMLAGVDIVSSVKFSDDAAKQPYSVTTVSRVDIENRHYNSVKELSAVAPNFFQPDYGSRMTSSVYVRGFGSRIDQPVVGLSIDQIPVMNKNNYDFELFDIDKVQVIRGAQSTLLGRNTAGGAINVTTLSPLTFQGKRLMVEGGNGGNIRVKAAHYAAPADDFGWSTGVYYSHSDGFFKNSYRGENCDGGDNAAVRLRAQWLPAGGWSIDNTLTAGYLREGGWGYHPFEEGRLLPIAYNEQCFYRRFSLSDGLVVKRFFDNFTFSSVTGYQYTDDKMHLDNDFLPLDYFVMEQAQREHSVTQELVVQSASGGAWRWQAGLSGFYKHLKMSAPVNFREDGIENLILGNLPWGSLAEDEFTIASNFTIPAYGAALYAQAGYTVGAFDFDAGVRFDYEYSSMCYDSRSLVHYGVINSATFTPYATDFVGRTAVDAFELLPSLSVTYRHKHGSLYAAARKGFKAGGFNTQIFSDILRNMMVDKLLGGTPTGNVSATKYHPEDSWNCEIGGRLSLFDDKLSINGALFYIFCSNQQVTVMSGTGRAMSNAGSSRSYGAELSARFKAGRFTVDGAYGYTNAKFKKYSDDSYDYAGNFLPYAPQETFSLNAACNLPVPHSVAGHLVLSMGLNGVGRIYWDTTNTLSQPFYCTLSASLSWEKGHFGASLWGKNLLDREYRTFYFESIGNKFFSLGKPLQAGLSLYVNL